MTSEVIMTNARLITAREVFLGTLVVKDDKIEDLGTGRSHLPGAYDCQGAYLAPGLVELHTDNLEKHFVPRPGVKWPGASAALSHDGQIISAGITTVFDALSLGDVVENGDRGKNLNDMLEAVSNSQQQDRHRAQHFVHLRCEVSREETLELFEKWIDHPLVRLVSVMDHSPGQRQFANLDKYRIYYQGKYDLDDLGLEVFMAKQQEGSARFSEPYRNQIVRSCKLRGIPVASHDDATREHVEEAYRHGMSIAEFPTTMEAAGHCARTGMQILMGAPNVVRGGSHSGNVAATDLAKEGLLDILSSDYYPASLLQAALNLTDEAIGYGLSHALDTVTRKPARAAGLMDRGELAVDMRADLIVFDYQDAQVPILRHVFRAGKKVY